MYEVRRPAALALISSAVAALGSISLPARAAELATLVSSTPVTAQVAVPRQSCVQGQQYVQQRPSGAGALIGAVAGGLLGSTVGGGFGRAAATGVGVVAGSVLGDNVEANANPVTAVPVQRCQTVTTYENRLVGYDVVYDYAGQRHSARMGHEPAARFAVDVRPAGQPLALAAPAAPAVATPSMPVPVYAGPAYPAPAYPASAYPAPSYAAEQVAPAPVYYNPLAAPVVAAPVYGGYPAGAYAPAPIVYGAPAVSIGVGLGYYGGGRRRWH